MKNISFDNPYLLLIAIPLLLVVLIPYFISKNKDNKSVGWLSSLIIHIVIVASVSLAAAGLIHTTTITRTKVYVLADVSYSSSRNLDKIDEYIAKINESLPANSRLGIICFGKDAEILTSSGTAIKSVKESNVDDSETNIAGAIEFASQIFSENEIKRIILITDGFATQNEGRTAAKIEEAVAKGIKIDAIYLDNNLKDGETEVQISDVNYTKSTYLNHESKLSMVLESSVAVDVTVSLSVKGEDYEEYTQIDKTVVKAEQGINLASFDLQTNIPGVFDYKLEITNAANDSSPYNNTYSFTQTVAQKRSVLLITGDESDVTLFESLYGESAEIDSYVINSSNNYIPYTVEKLAKYDEMIVANVDIREENIPNIRAFIDSADAVISQYGKSLITFGDLHMQNTENDESRREVYAKFEELLPVEFGNANKDEKLYTIIIDVSRSMAYSNHAQIRVAKDAASKLISILEDGDSVSLILFAGEAKMYPPRRLGDPAPEKDGNITNREYYYQLIQGAELSQGTMIGAALEMAYKEMMGYTRFEEKQVMLISDGKPYAYEEEDITACAENMKNSDILLSTVLVLPHSPTASCNPGNCKFMRDLAKAGGGTAYHLVEQEKVADLVFTTIGDKLTDSVVEGQTAVNIESRYDETLVGILEIPDIYGYINTKKKPDATMVLSVDYQKNSQTTVEVPLYCYRDHGNGRVASFTSDINGDWLSGWSSELKATFFGNVLTTNTPKERIDYPYEIKLEHQNNSTTIELHPTYLTTKAKAWVEITTPDGKVISGNQGEPGLQLNFDLNKYVTTFDTPLVGRYHIKITYTYGNNSFVSNTYYTISYGSEYNAFATYDVADIHDFMRSMGRISTDGNLDLENSKADIETYELDFTIPLLIVAVVLFVVDVFIRKFTWRDIKGFFRKSKKGGR